MNGRRQTIGITIISLIFIGMLAYLFRERLFEVVSYSEREAITSGEATNIKADFETSTHFFGKPPGIGATVEWSYDGSKYAKVVQAGREKKPEAEFSDFVQQVIVVDRTGKQTVMGGKYDTIKDVAFTKDGKHLAFIASRYDNKGKITNSTVALVIDGIEGNWQTARGNILTLPAEYFNNERIKPTLTQSKCPNIKYVRESYNNVGGWVEIAGKRSVNYIVPEANYPLISSSDCKKVIFVAERKGGLVVGVGNDQGDFSLSSTLMSGDGLSIPKFSTDNNFIGYGGWASSGREEGLWWIVEPVP